MEYCCHVWDSAPSCYLKLLNKLEERLCRTVVPSLAVSLERLAHTLVDFFLNWLNWFHFLILEEGPHNILIHCMIFVSQFLDVTGMSMYTVSFLTQLNSGILCL